MYDEKAIKHYQHGIELRQKGKLVGAERAYSKAIKISKNFVEAYNNLGNVLLDLGRLKEAAQVYRKALKLLPRHPMLLNNLGNALQLQGETEAAIEYLNKALVEDPDYADAHSNLGNALRDSSCLEAAADSYRRALAIDSQLADTYNNLGGLLLELKQLDAAIINFEQSIEIEPMHKNAYNGLGNALNEQDEIEKAIAAYQRAIEIDPQHIDAYNGLGKAMKKQGELEKARELFLIAIKIDPRNKHSYSGLGSVQSDMGEIEDSLASYRKAIEISPQYGAAYRSIAKNKKFSEYDRDIRAMESLSADENTAEEDAMHLAFGLGKAFEDLGQYQKSMEYIFEATRLNRSSLDYSIKQDQEKFKKIKSIFSPEFISERTHFGNPDSTPIFILGMPRSGTSLTEQILASHPDVFGAGELRHIFDMVKLTASHSSSGKYPDCLVNLEANAFEVHGKNYVTKIRKHAADSKFITDKMPHNFLNLGFIHTILPNAKIICCTRDPMDNCLSLFKNYFTNGHYYSYDLQELGQYYNLYLDLMAHWKNTLPGFIYDLNYEALISDQENQIRKLLEYCNLPWDDACLQFHKTRRKVATASNAQVRQPIYKDSVKLWKRYETQLEPLRAAIYD